MGHGIPGRELEKSNRIVYTIRRIRQQGGAAWFASPESDGPRQSPHTPAVCYGYQKVRQQNPPGLLLTVWTPGVELRANWGPTWHAPASGGAGQMIRGTSPGMP